LHFPHLADSGAKYLPGDPMRAPLYDAHIHLQDERLRPHLAGIMEAVAEEGITRMVVNGSCEADWPAVIELAKQYPGLVLASFGYHPWYVKQRSADWQRELIRYLDEIPSAIGEIGLDRWIKDHDTPQQEEVFVSQLRLAAERNLPVSIHCLQAWGGLLEILQHEPRPDCGFVLHSFGGPKEMIPRLAELGAYFSLPGYFAHERKEKQREAFRHVPTDRLLIETDAPDQLLPETRIAYPLREERSGKALNHPANLRAVYMFAAELTGCHVEDLAKLVEQNFRSVFGRVMRDA
jgi:TatD DNase family protein